VVFNTGPYTVLPDNSILITAKMQSETGFPSSHQLKSYVASKSRLKLAARAVLSADAGLLVTVVVNSKSFPWPVLYSPYTESTLPKKTLLRRPKKHELECGPMSNVMAALPNAVAPSVQRRKIWLTPTTRVPCSNAAKMRNPFKFGGVPQTRQQISGASAVG